MALCSKGYALRLLKGIPFFGGTRLLYWGDLDEDGYLILDNMRGYYPHVECVLMDEATVAFHPSEMREGPFQGKRTDLRLHADEAAGYRLL
ncbi:MAG TPA: Wadjet anti-phage system protein JetD domain-containing protein, partial [Flavisolibacter sp.]